MKERSYRVLLWILAVCGLALDQGSKYAVFAWLAPGDYEDRTFTLFHTDRGGFQLVAQFQRDDVTRLPYLHNGRPVPHVNHGALWGIFRDHTWLANAAFALVSLLAAAAIIYWSRQKSTAGDRWLCAALGLILAGTLGNLYDRVFFGGVRDFLHWNWRFDWPVFNVADCCLVCGACLLLLQAFSPQSAPVPDPGLTPPAHADLATASKG
jgi:lipoprotein signal peptidase